ncbi:MAG TPA: alpha/beta hydrolase [Rhizomicrobium sp.]
MWVRVLGAVALLLFTGLAEAGEFSPPTSGFVTSADGTRINYVDWGGSGPAIVMIHGLGDDPYVFSAIAEHLRGQFHIVAYARRGHGHSDAPLDRKYDLPTYVADMRAVFDQLHFAHASLVGWSMGGNEITGFAVKYPRRVDKLIYLESGYDWSDANLSNRFAVIAPKKTDLSSFGAYEKWWLRVWYGAGKEWVPAIAPYLNDTARIAPDGSVTVVPTDAVMDKIMHGLAAPRDYTRIKAPVMAIYADRFFPDIPGDAAYNKDNAAFEKGFDAFRLKSIARIEHDIPNASICRLADRTHMSIGFEHNAWLAKAMAAFLEAPKNAAFDCHGMH